MTKSERDFYKVAFAMSISEMGEKSSQIGTQTQIEIAGLEVIQYQNDNHRKHIHPWNQSMTTVFVFNTISCVSILGLMLSIWYFNRAVDTTHCETMHFVFPKCLHILRMGTTTWPQFWRTRRGLLVPLSRMPVTP